jgi:hypothetical protein
MENEPPSRSTLAVAWASFLVVWILLALLSLGASHIACDLENNALGVGYCEAVHDYLESGEPGELTTALVYLWPPAVLLGIGLVGIWARRARLLVAVGAVALAAIVVHVVLAFTA